MWWQARSHGTGRSDFDQYFFNFKLMKLIGQTEIKPTWLFRPGLLQGEIGCRRSQPSRTFIEPQTKKKPLVRRRQGGGGEEYFPESVDDKYCEIYYEGLDLCINHVRSRFDQPGYSQYKKLETLLVKSAAREPRPEESVKLIRIDGRADQGSRESVEILEDKLTIKVNFRIHRLELMKFQIQHGESVDNFVQRCKEKGSIIGAMTNVCKNRWTHTSTQQMSSLQGHMPHMQQEGTLGISVSQHRGQHRRREHSPLDRPRSDHAGRGRRRSRSRRGRGGRHVHGIEKDE